MSTVILGGGESLTSHDVKANVIPLFGDKPPTTIDGLLLPKWLVHHTVVDDVRPYRDPVTTDFGTIAYNQYSMSDGTCYRMVQGKPSEQRTAVSVDGTTPWGTQPEGVTALTDQALMRLGYPTRRIGPEYFPDINLLDPFAIYQAVCKGLNVSLGYSAHNMAEILETSDELTPSATPGISLIAGESRNSMIEPGLNALGRIRPNKRFIAHADNIDPCDFSSVGGFNPLRLGKTVLYEGAAMLRTGYHALTSNDRPEYSKAVDFSPGSSIPSITLANALTSEQAATLAVLRPLDSPMHLRFMKHSLINGRKALENIYASHPRVHIATPRNGAHIDVLRLKFEVVRRHSLMLDQLQKNGDDPTNLDFEQVYELAQRRGRGILKVVV